MGMAVAVVEVAEMAVGVAAGGASESNTGKNGRLQGGVGEECKMVKNHYILASSSCVRSAEKRAALPDVGAEAILRR